MDSVTEKYTVIEMQYQSYTFVQHHLNQVLPVNIDVGYH